MKRLVWAVASASLLVACGGGGGAVDCPEPEVLSGTLSGEVVVGADCKNWSVPSTVTVPDGAKLVIQPGTALTFGAGASLVVRAGKLEALGTEDAPILFTGAEKTPGSWGGVVLQDASSTENTLSHVTIEYGGSAPSGSGMKAALRLSGTAATPSRLALTASTLRHGSGHGLAIDAFSRLPVFTGNALTSNADGAAAAHPMSVGQLVADNVYTGNARDRVVVPAGEIRSGEATFHAIGVPFHVGALDVLADGRLVIAPSVTVAFEPGARLRLADGGRLVAEGTATAPIVITGVESTPGSWQGIFVQDAGSTENVIAHATVESAGIQDGWAAAAANIALTHAGARMRIHDAVIRSSAGYGIYVDARATLEFSHNALTANALGAAYAFAGVAHVFDAGSSYAGNTDGNDFVRIARSPLEADVTWQALDVPFRLDDVNVRSHLTIQPGAVVELDAGKFLRFESTARLSAVGTSTARIQFRGAAGAEWNGLQFQSTLQDNRLEYASVTNVGSGAWSWSQAPHGAVRLYQSRLSVANSRFVNNQGYGIWQSPSITTVSNCGSAIFEGNSAGVSNRTCL